MGFRQRWMPLSPAANVKAENISAENEQLVMRTVGSPMDTRSGPSFLRAARRVREQEQPTICLATLRYWGFPFASNPQVTIWQGTYDQHLTPYFTLMLRDQPPSSRLRTREGEATLHPPPSGPEMINTLIATASSQNFLGQLRAMSIRVPAGPAFYDGPQHRDGQSRS